MSYYGTEYNSGMNHRSSQYFSLRNLNRLLMASIVAICLYIIIFPYVPQLTYSAKDTFNIKPALVSAGTQAPSSSYPAENTLVIPSINLQAQIHDGAYANTLNKGIWRRPNTDAPDKDGNTVLAGHRFTYSDPAVFYHLDKVKIGDEIITYWNMQKYIYKVSGIKEVAPTAVEIENSSEKPMLTLYTCTPLWTSKYRLVVIADLIEASK